MEPVSIMNVEPAIPDKLARLRDLAYNLRWTWDHETFDLFRRLGGALFEKCEYNPVDMLGKMSQDDLNAAAEDDGFVALLERVAGNLDEYLERETTWFNKVKSRVPNLCIGYFSFEFGITECLKMYGGGLGALAGDHLKAASAIGLPLVGVGLIYQKGYFQQYLNAGGWQQESYPVHDFYRLPLQIVRDEDGNEARVSVEFPGREVFARVWIAKIGRIPLYLLDTNIPVNAPEDQDITDELYGGDIEMRIRQELLLGIGGVRTLHALGYEPTVFHMNEGHSAFSAIERIHMLKEKGLSFSEAKEAVSAGSIFTTHTPVPAGIDKFEPELLEKYLCFHRQRLGLNKEEFLSLGRIDSTDKKAQFSMAVLAIKLAACKNGVSRLHGQVARSMWHDLWPDVSEDDVPITSVTNGVHYPTWISHDFADLAERFIGPHWASDPTNPHLWKRIQQVPPDEVWRTHVRRRERLVGFARRRLEMQLKRRGAGPAELGHAREVLDSRALTIGIARRFATYKRSTLILSDLERLRNILCNPDKPVQLIFAGKAHPQDQPGKEFIQKIIRVARMPDFRDHIVFLEDYDFRVARYLVQGCDVWLNTPRRPREACGTSGMKAVANGVLNLSVLDGWWDEAFKSNIGWAIGGGEHYSEEQHAHQDQVESEAMYELIEKDVVPLFYDRGRDRLPRRWIEMMKSAMSHCGPVFNASRMVYEYAERFYFEASERYRMLTGDSMAGAKKLAEWTENVRAGWKDIKIERIFTVDCNEECHQVGRVLEINAVLRLGKLTAGDVDVELYHGNVDPKGAITDAKSLTMTHLETEERGTSIYSGLLPLKASGRYGYTVRVLPASEKLPNRLDMGLVMWAPAPKA
ncbi:MAG: alpha-glucan family phosphorylase [Planctomycetota bacterium]|jgi:starch phosphorylase